MIIITRRVFLGAPIVFVARRRQGRVTGGPERSALQAAQPGRHNLKLENNRDGVLYVPAGYTVGTPMPLILMLHGAGGSGERMTYTFPLADEFGAIVLAPDSRDERSWDAALGGWGPDLEFLGRAVRRTSELCSIDRARMCVAGFSDGASYALSLGIGSGDVFSHVAAFSPGFMRPRDAQGKPRIFISHGTNDQVMPIDVTSRKFVPSLKALGYDVTYREYEGRHGVPLPIVREAFEWFLK
jgi:phospholipase/carboxylesterase